MGGTRGRRPVAAPAGRGAMITRDGHGLRKERAIVSETQLDSAATGRSQPDAETGEADEVSDNSEQADDVDPVDPVGPSDDVTAPAGGDTAPAEGDTAPAEGDALAEGDADSAQEEFMRELRMQPGDWYVVHSYAGYENRVKTNLESRITSLNMEDYISRSRCRLTR